MLIIFRINKLIVNEGVSTHIMLDRQIIREKVIDITTKNEAFVDSKQASPGSETPNEACRVWSYSSLLVNREPNLSTEEPITSFSSKYRISEQVIKKYTKSHIFEVKTMKQF